MVEREKRERRRMKKEAGEIEQMGRGDEKRVESG